MNQKATSFKKLLFGIASLIVLQFSGLKADAQYCTTGISGTGCIYSDYIQSFYTTGGISTISNYGTGCASGSVGYSDYTGLSASAIQGTTVVINAINTPSYYEYYAAWIDWNQDGDFDDLGEQVMPQTYVAYSGTVSASISVPFSATLGTTRMRIRCSYSTTTITGCSYEYESETEDYSFTIIAATPCSGAPTAGTITPSSPASVCAGNSLALGTTGTTAAGSLIYQWQQSSDGGATWTDAPGGTSPTYTTPALSDTILYRFYVVCTPSGLSDTTLPLTINVTSPTYATIPYTQGFESWSNFCSTSDVPDNHWVNFPATGVSSWRRDDQGSTAGWSFPFSGTYFPAYVAGSHSARFHQYEATAPGRLDLYIDCSTVTGGKLLQFNYITNPYYYDYDTVKVSYSTDGGTTFTNLGSFGWVATWTNVALNVPSNSPNTVIRFVADGAYTYYNDIGLDEVSVSPPCTGTPTAGSIAATPTTACTGHSVTLTNTGGSLAGGLSYQWQLSTDGGTTWTAATGGSGLGTTVYTTPPLSDTTQYRMVLVCTTSGLSDTTNAINFNVASPVYASLPFVESFESWVNHCSTKDIPNASWTNVPATGNNSWRREDEGSTASWVYPTLGTYSPVAIDSSHSARYHVYNYGTAAAGDLSFYIDCSTYTGAKLLQFYYITDAAYYSYDSLHVSYSTDGGATFTSAGDFGPTTTGVWTLESMNIPSNSATTVIRFRAFAPYTYYNDIGLDYVTLVPPCAGTPVAGTSTSPLLGCVGGTKTLAVTGASLAGGLTYQWQTSADGITWTDVAGATSATYTTPAFSDTIYYRRIIGCTVSGLFDTTNTIEIDVTAPIYAALPYVQGFESWSSFCSINDVPDYSWNNNPSTGNSSWRRNDDGGSAGWIYPIYGTYSPSAQEGSYSARFHSYQATSAGNLDVYVDCSPIMGAKELRFYYNMGSYSYYDNLSVQYSTDGGVTFSPMASYGTPAVTDNWNYVSLSLFSNSATTVVRFTGSTIYTYTDDIGIDNVQIIPPCQATPTAGTVVATPACSGQNFELSTVGGSLASGLTYQWQMSTDGVTWTSIVGATSATDSANITSPTYFRVIVTCTASGMSDTSAGLLVDLAPFYYCYCASYSYDPYTLYGNVGNVTLTDLGSGGVLLDNGNPSPFMSNPTATNYYSTFSTTIPPVVLFRDSSYNVSMSEITAQSYLYDAVCVAWIDFNRNGAFEATERVLLGTVPATASSGEINQNFTVPSGAGIGITGMRVLLSSGYSTTTSSPCGAYYDGETEDYLVDIQYPPCSGPPNAGTAVISDSATCVGYPIDLYDVTHDSTGVTGLSWGWQQSLDGGASWTNIPGSAGSDYVNDILVMGPTDYRFFEICSNTSDTSYSNVVSVVIYPPIGCYGTSFASGPDSSDVGAFKMGPLVTSAGGPHLGNPKADRAWTNWSWMTPVILYTDSTYELDVYHILQTFNHADAKITVFIDYNHNMAYDVPNELVWTGYTSATDWYKTAAVTIPATVVKNVPTGMRVILNNDVTSNSASDLGYGTYASGETEDYVVLFKKGTLGVGNLSTINDASVYPNPSDGHVYVQMNLARPANNIEIRVTTVTGEQIMHRVYDGAASQFVTQLDLSNQAKGIYFIELKADGDKITRKLIVR